LATLYPQFVKHDATGYWVAVYYTDGRGAGNYPMEFFNLISTINNQYSYKPGFSRANLTTGTTNIDAYKTKACTMCSYELTAAGRVAYEAALKGVEDAKRRVSAEYPLYLAWKTSNAYQTPANSAVITASRPVTQTNVPTQIIAAPIQSLFSTPTTQGIPVPTQNNLVPLLVVAGLVGLVLLVK